MTQKRTIIKADMIMEYSSLSEAAREWANNLSKDWIHWLATAEPIEIVQHLQSSTGGVNTVVDRVLRRTALHYAAETGDKKLVQHLCSDARTRCQVEDIRGDTALDLALVNRHMIIAHLLLEKMIQDGEYRADTGLRTANIVYGN